MRNEKAKCVYTKKVGTKFEEQVDWTRAICRVARGLLWTHEYKQIASESTLTFVNLKEIFP